MMFFHVVPPWGHLKPAKIAAKIARVAADISRVAANISRVTVDKAVEEAKSCWPKKFWDFQG